MVLLFCSVLYIVPISSVTFAAIVAKICLYYCCIFGSSIVFVVRFSAALRCLYYYKSLKHPVTLFHLIINLILQSYVQLYINLKL
jgi:hypothetical protein